MSWYWRLYAALLLSAGFGQMLHKLLTDTGGFSSRYGAAIVAIVLVIMMIARSKEIALGKPWPWQVFLFGLGLTCFTALGFAIYLLLIGVFLPAALLGLAILLLLPALQQLYLYAFRSPAIWSRDKA